MMAPIFLKSKEEALPDIKNWLVSAFQEKKGCCVPKKDVFGAYADFCAAHHYESTTSASFGKFLKKIFPGVETRRLVRNDVQAMYYHNLTQTATEHSGPSSPGCTPTVVHMCGAPRPALAPSQLEPEQTYAHQPASSAHYATSRWCLPASPTLRISASSPPPQSAQTTAPPPPYHFNPYGLLPVPPDAQHLQYHHFLPQRQDSISAAARVSWEGLYYLHSLLAAATQPLPLVPPRPKRRTTRRAQKAGDRPTLDHNHNHKRKREEHEERRADGGSDVDSGDQDKQHPISNDTRRTKSRLDYILN